MTPSPTRQWVFLVFGAGGLAVVLSLLVFAVVTVSDDSVRHHSGISSAPTSFHPAAPTASPPKMTPTKTASATAAPSPDPTVAATAPTEDSTPARTAEQSPNPTVGVLTRLRDRFPRLFPRSP
jgi:hypothetical protein